MRILSLIIISSISLTSCTIMQGGVQQNQTTATQSTLSGYQKEIKNVDNEQLSNNISSGTHIASDKLEEDDMIDDSLTIISGRHETSCIDTFNTFVQKLEDIRPEGSEATIEYLDIMLLPKINHCILGYMITNDTSKTIIVEDIDTGEELTKFECIADYDVESDIIIPCENEKYKIMKKEYDSYMSDFVIQNP